MNGTGNISESTENLKSKSPSVLRSTRLRFGLRTLLIVTLVVGVFLAVSTWLVHKAEESHARSCLITISELADDTIHISIPKKDYRKAIEAAAYITLYYPPGTLLPQDHPFAREYEVKRQHRFNASTTR